MEGVCGSRPETAESFRLSLEAVTLANWDCAEPPAVKKTKAQSEGMHQKSILYFNTRLLSATTLLKSQG
jgi:hypothetical protein